MIAPQRTELDILRLVAKEAATRSMDPRTQNAAALVRPDDIMVVAANAIPTGVVRSPGRLEPPAKYDYIEHAERAAIYKAASFGWTTGGSTLYALWFACPDCARAIISAGVYEVVGLAKARSLTPDRWLDAVETGEQMLREAGVGMRWLADPLGVSIRFNGKEVQL